MTGAITDIHATEPIGTIRVEIRRGPRGEAMAARNVTIDLMWPPVERTERYRNACECREVYAVANGDECRAAFGLPKAPEQRFVCACFFVGVPHAPLLMERADRLEQAEVNRGK